MTDNVDINQKTRDIIHKAIQSISKDFDGSFGQSAIIHPIDTLMDFIYGVSPVSSVLNREPVEQPLYNYFKYVNGNFPANPNNEELSIIYDEIYHKEGGESYSTLLKEKVDEFSLEFTKGIAESRYFRLVGNRGRGKTMLTNRYFTKYTKTLEQNNIVWFRVDSNKIYDVQSVDFDSKISLLEAYYLAHTAYVLFRYSFKSPRDTTRRHRSSLFSEIYKNISDQVSENSRELESIFIKWDRVFVNYKSKPAYNELFLSERMVEDIIFSRHGFEADEAAIVVRLFFKEFEKRETRIVNVIDGIDNVAWSKSNENYTRMCEETANFLKHYTSKYPNIDACMCLVTRPETIPEIEQYLTTEGYQQEPMGVREKISFDEYKIPISKISSIIDTKDSAAIDASVFSEKMGAAVEKSFENASRENRGEGYIQFRMKISKIFREHSESYLERLADVINQRLSHSNQVIDLRKSHSWPKHINADQVFTFLFNENARATIDARLNTIRSQKVFENLGRAYSDENQRVMQYTLLGGNPYKYSQKFLAKNRGERIPRGNIIPNIFWYDLKKADSPYFWESLAGLRLLQLAMHSPNTSMGEQLDLLVAYFGYSEAVLSEVLETFIAYGLLDIDYESGTRETNVDNTTLEKKYAGYAKITKKAYIVSQFSLYDPEFLYFLCLDTPMRRTTVTQMSAINFHIDFDLIGDFHDFYTDSQCVNCYTLLRCIFMQNKLEMDVVRKKKTEKEHFLSKNHVLSIFDLEGLKSDVLESTLTEAINRCSDANRKICKERDSGLDVRSYFDFLKDFEATLDSEKF